MEFFGEPMLLSHALSYAMSIASLTHLIAVSRTFRNACNLTNAWAGSVVDLTRVLVQRLEACSRRLVQCAAVRVHVSQVPLIWNLGKPAYIVWHLDIPYRHSRLVWTTLCCQNNWLRGADHLTSHFAHPSIRLNWQGQLVGFFAGVTDASDVASLRDAAQQRPSTWPTRVFTGYCDLLGWNLNDGLPMLRWWANGRPILVPENAINASLCVLRSQSFSALDVAVEWKRGRLSVFLNGFQVGVYNFARMCDDFNISRWHFAMKFIFQRGCRICASPILTRVDQSESTFE
jgi:hypothetical protein